MIRLPQPFEEIDHTADAGVRVSGATAEETLARLVLGMTQIISGASDLRGEGWVTLAIEPGSHAEMAVDLLRELLYRFDCEGWLASACEVSRLDPPRGLEVALERYPFDPDAHPEGVELKAVTLHEARFEQVGEGWRAQVLFDV